MIIGLCSLLLLAGCEMGLPDEATTCVNDGGNWCLVGGLDESGGVDTSVQGCVFGQVKDANPI